MNLKNQNKIKWILLILFLFSVTIGCDKIRPNIHPEKKGNERGWYFGCSFKTEW